jgi:hypothetical protein
MQMASVNQVLPLPDGELFSLHHQYLLFVYTTAEQDKIGGRRYLP